MRQDKSAEPSSAAFWLDDLEQFISFSEPHLQNTSKYSKF
jgi:hypothetical protein